MIKHPQHGDYRLALFAARGTPPAVEPDPEALIVFGMKMRDGHVNRKLVKVSPITRDVPSPEKALRTITVKDAKLSDVPPAFLAYAHAVTYPSDLSRHTMAAFQTMLKDGRWLPRKDGRAIETLDALMKGFDSYRKDLRVAKEKETQERDEERERIENMAHEARGAIRTTDEVTDKTWKKITQMLLPALEANGYSRDAFPLLTLTANNPSYVLVFTPRPYVGRFSTYEVEGHSWEPAASSELPYVIWNLARTMQNEANNVRFFQWKKFISHFGNEIDVLHTRFLNPEDASDISASLAHHVPHVKEPSTSECVSVSFVAGCPVVVELNGCVYTREAALHEAGENDRFYTVRLDLESRELDDSLVYVETVAEIDAAQLANDLLKIDDLLSYLRQEYQSGKLRFNIASGKAKTKDGEEVSRTVAFANTMAPSITPKHKGNQVRLSLPGGWKLTAAHSQSAVGYDDYGEITDETDWDQFTQDLIKSGLSPREVERQIRLEVARQRQIKNTQLQAWFDQIDWQAITETIRAKEGGKGFWWYMKLRDLEGAHTRYVSEKYVIFGLHQAPGHQVVQSVPYILNLNAAREADRLRPANADDFPVTFLAWAGIVSQSPDKGKLLKDVLKHVAHYDVRSGETKSGTTQAIEDIIMKTNARRQHAQGWSPEAPTVHTAKVKPLVKAVEEHTLEEKNQAFKKIADSNAWERVLPKGDTGKSYFKFGFKVQPLPGMIKGSYVVWGTGPSEDMAPVYLYGVGLPNPGWRKANVMDFPDHIVWHMLHLAHKDDYDDEGHPVSQAAQSASHLGDKYKIYPYEADLVDKAMALKLGFKPRPGKTEIVLKTKETLGS